MRSIPHLNELQARFGKRGLTIVGVTDEPASKIRPFITKHGIEYTIAIGGASGYSTRGIPRAWLVSPDGNVVWEGHPAALKDAQIETHLANVQLTPSFELPKALSSAQKSLDAGKYSKGMEALKKYIARHKNTPAAEDNVKAARAALHEVYDYGKARYKSALDLAKDAYYSEAIGLMQELDKSFKGTKLGDKAKEKYSSWKKDKTVKAELKAEKLHVRAKELIRKKKYRDAGAFLKRLLKSSSLAETKTRVRAEETYRQIRQYL